ncbi:MAG: hypothetical protein GTO45_30325 [Candidatus Aminicenantes bacterium]|nr:hypothetical protein [Candidatus Aminicenantes bacterium]NIM83090.1 hypothetical protein [Candidatus Aminicenantes bacterium]NIN22469.1 hypothetical protein [Candidatus Aminicenantes bacterium]NIN46237.1 hypothetical protein [Candidatus Aminicenantes bacterium]NIN89074.1 hypothetical protein [Candidatus Aminicenantes bacterium]
MTRTDKRAMGYHFSMNSRLLKKNSGLITDDPLSAKNESVIGFWCHQMKESPLLLQNKVRLETLFSK